MQLYVIILAVLFSWAAQGQSLASLMATQQIPAGFSQIETYELESRYETSKVMPLTVIINRASPWNRTVVENMVRKAEDIFNSCGLSLEPISITEARHPELDHLSCADDFLYTQDIPETMARPVVSFTQNIDCYYGAAGGYANPKYHRDHNHEDISLNTAFIDSVILNPFADTGRATDGLIAHELLHVLLDAGHNYIDGNIFADNKYQRGYEVTPAQCETLLKHPLVKNR